MFVRHSLITDIIAMASAARNIDWKAYEQDRPKLSIRIGRSEKTALDLACKQRGASVTDLLLGYLRPIISEGTPEGQRAHQIITAAVQASVAWNSANDRGFGDTEPKRDQNGDPIMDEWRSPDIIVRPRITKGGAIVLYHTVTHRMGETRNDAIRRYVASIIRVWADTPEDQRDALLAEIGDWERHRFVIGFANFREWTSFPESYEMGLHYAMHQKPYIATPANDDESAFIKWAREYLSNAWQGAGRQRGDVITIAEGHRDADSGMLLGQDFRHYAMRSDAENIDAWAGVWLNEYRKLCGGMGHDNAMAYVKGQRIRVRMMTFSE